MTLPTIFTIGKLYKLNLAPNFRNNGYNRSYYRPKASIYHLFDKISKEKDGIFRFKSSEQQLSRYVDFDSVIMPLEQEPVMGTSLAVTSYVSGPTNFAMEIKSVIEFWKSYKYEPQIYPRPEPEKPPVYPFLKVCGMFKNMKEEERWCGVGYIYLGDNAAVLEPM